VKRLKVKVREAYNRRNGAKKAIQEIVDSEKKCTGNILKLCLTK